MRKLTGFVENLMKLMSVSIQNTAVLDTFRLKSTSPNLDRNLVFRQIRQIWHMIKMENFFCLICWYRFNVFFQLHLPYWVRVSKLAPILTSLFCLCQFPWNVSVLFPEALTFASVWNYSFPKHFRTISFWPWHPDFGQFTCISGWMFTKCRYPFHSRQKTAVCIITGRNEVVAKVMFLHVSVILLTAGGVSGEPPRTREEPPRDQADPPWQGDPPWTREEPPRTRQTPPAGRTPPEQADPPQEEDCSIRSMSGRYASYWNAFLFAFGDHCVDMRDKHEICRIYIPIFGPGNQFPQFQTITSCFIEKKWRLWDFSRI